MSTQYRRVTDRQTLIMLDRSSHQQWTTVDNKPVSDLKESVASVELKYDTTNTPDITRLWPAELCTTHTQTTTNTPDITRLWPAELCTTHIHGRQPTLRTSHGCDQPSSVHIQSRLCGPTSNSNNTLWHHAVVTHQESLLVLDNDASTRLCYDVHDQMSLIQSLSVEFQTTLLAGNLLSTNDTTCTRIHSFTDDTQPYNILIQQIPPIAAYKWQ